MQCSPQPEPVDGRSVPRAAAGSPATVNSSRPVAAVGAPVRHRRADAGRRRAPRAEHGASWSSRPRAAAGAPSGDGVRAQRRRREAHDDALGPDRQTAGEARRRSAAFHQPHGQTGRSSATATSRSNTGSRRMASTCAGGSDGAEPAPPA